MSTERDRLLADIEQLAREHWVVLQFDDLDSDPRAILQELAREHPNPLARDMFTAALAVDMSKSSNRKGVAAALKLAPKSDEVRFNELVYTLVENARAQRCSIEESIELVTDVLVKLGAEMRFGNLSHETMRKRHQRMRKQRCNTPSKP